MKQGKLFGGILLVSGTTIGAGMLALPVSTGISGFYTSIFLFFVIWMVMTYTAFLMLEVNMWMKKDANLISMAQYTLGFPGKVLAWSAYLVLLYLLNTAYISVGSALLVDGAKVITGFGIPKWVGPLPFIMIFGSFVYMGTRAVDYINRLFMMGLCITYAIVVILVTPHIDQSFLDESHFRYIPVAVSVIITAFGFHIIIPSLTKYLDRDVKKIKTAIFVGSLVPLLVYILWEFVISGVVPISGDPGLLASWRAGDNAVKPLQIILANPWISLIASFLAFFVIVTSFLGVALSLTDFLSDGLKIQKNHSGKIMLSCIAFIPPLVISLTYPRAFLSALEYAGAFGVAILLGILPAAMTWVGRYRMNIDSEYKTPGGRWALIAVMVFFSCVIMLVVAEKVHWLKLIRTMMGT